MRLATYRAKDGAARAAVVSGEHLHDIAQQIAGAPSDMIGVIEALERLRPELEALSRKPGGLALAQVRLLAPVPRPGKIMALGLNYRDHVAEAKMTMPEHQTWFAKMGTAVNGPFDDVLLPKVSTRLDYEAELAMVIGRRAKHVPRASARDVIAGFCAANDVSVRDWQLRTSQFIIGKSFDTHCPFGPYIVTTDEITDPQALAIRCSVNGEMRQDSSTREMIFGVYEMIEHLSQAMTLEPGDVILTGTPAGVGAVTKPPRYLKAGDVVRIEIERVGAIENRVVDEAA